ncbi:Epoxide hydrolase 3 [Papilio machaon]|uniref:Epoxide hydrolase 3 n=1 Tax=Papilio machaon TaxID=76193 RepID=A0A194R3X9_PAPMA|nr:Epoxide hydrolase 3 [Papilio machaon]
MSFTVIQRFVVANILTVVYSSIFAIVIFLNSLIYQLKYIGKQKPKFVPPASLTDRKYGVHKYIKANNVKLHYVESGDPSKPLLLFLHGFPEFWYTWRHQIVEFNKDYCCVALDMRGYGDSEKPEGVSSYKLDILVEDVRDFIRKLGRSKCILVSHDWGGIVASKFRDTHPEYLDGIIMFASITRESWHREIWSSFTAPVNYYRAVFSLTCPEKYIDNNVPMLVANAEKDVALVPNLLNRIKEEYKYVETILVKDTRHFLQEQEPEKNLFINSGKQSVLSPPASLSDPKYGVHKYVKANNVKLHYVESGDPSKPLMCVAVDMRGYGDSDKPEGLNAYKIDVLVEDVRDFMRKLGRNKCILVGHDWGGIVATKFRDTHPETLDALILLASISRESWSREIWSNLDQNKKSWYIFFYRMPKLAELTEKLTNMRIFDIVFNHGNKKLDENTMKCYRYVFPTPASLTPPISYYRANFQLTFPKKYIENNVPMLVANAELDVALAPTLLDRMKEEYKYIETMVVKNSHHFYQEEEPEKANKIIRDFLAKNNL